MTSSSAENSQPEEFEMSPSERMGDRAASRIAGGGETHKTQRALASIVLGFELIVVFLVGLTVFGLEIVTPAYLGIIGGLIMCAIIVVALGIMRRGRAGIWLGWAIHAVYFIAGALLLPIIFVGVVFTALWAFCMIRGAQIDRERARALAD